MPLAQSSWWRRGRRWVRLNAGSDVAPTGIPVLEVQDEPWLHPADWRHLGPGDELEPGDYAGHVVMIWVTLCPRSDSERSLAGRFLGQHP